MTGVFAQGFINYHILDYKMRPIEAALLEMRQELSECSRELSEFREESKNQLEEIRKRLEH